MIVFIVIQLFPLMLVGFIAICKPLKNSLIKYFFTIRNKKNNPKWKFIHRAEFFLVALYFTVSIAISVNKINISQPSMTSLLNAAIILNFLNVFKTFSLSLIERENYKNKILKSKSYLTKKDLELRIPILDWKIKIFSILLISWIIIALFDRKLTLEITTIIAESLPIYVLWYNLLDGFITVYKKVNDFERKIIPFESVPYDIQID